MFKFVKGIFDSEQAGENVIGAQVKIYNDTKTHCPGDDPHVLLAKVYMSRLRARGFDISHPSAISKCSAETALAACLEEGFNIRAAAFFILQDERPDVISEHPKFKRQVELFLEPLMREIESGVSLMQLYRRKNPRNQIAQEFPAGYSALLELNEALKP